MLSVYIISWPQKELRFSFDVVNLLATPTSKSQDVSGKEAQGGFYEGYSDCTFGQPFRACDFDFIDFRGSRTWGSKRGVFQ
jgi:hypothetical protein